MHPASKSRSVQRGKTCLDTNSISSHSSQSSGSAPNSTSSESSETDIIHHREEPRNWAAKGKPASSKPTSTSNKITITNTDRTAPYIIHSFRAQNSDIHPKPLASNPGPGSSLTKNQAEDFSESTPSPRESLTRTTSHDGKVTPSFLSQSSVVCQARKRRSSVPITLLTCVTHGEPIVIDEPVTAVQKVVLARETDGPTTERVTGDAGRRFVVGLKEVWKKL